LVKDVYLDYLRLSISSLKVKILIF
jgi:hypothetical protein